MICAFLTLYKKMLVQYINCSLIKSLNISCSKNYKIWNCKYVLICLTFSTCLLPTKRRSFYLSWQYFVKHINKSWNLNNTIYLELTLQTINPAQSIESILNEIQLKIWFKNNAFLNFRSMKMGKDKYTI